MVWWHRTGESQLANPRLRGIAAFLAFSFCLRHRAQAVDTLSDIGAEPDVMADPSRDTGSEYSEKAPLVAPDSQEDLNVSTGVRVRRIVM